MEGQNVLVIDDSNDMRDLLTQLLESKGHSVSSSENGEDALVRLRSDGPLPSVILLDLRMPVMDGFHFLEKKNLCKRLRGIPVVMMTAEDDLTAVRNQYGVRGVLSKPMSISSVLSAIQMHSG